MSGRSRFSDKKKKAAREPSTPLTFEELLEGDRYKDGEKSRRFYERACGVYETAAGMKADDADVIYNWLVIGVGRARILLLLSEFTDPAYTPQERRNLLDLAIPKFRAVSTLEPTNADNLFNLAQALRGVAELALDGNGGGEAEAVRVLAEASEVLERVWALQWAEYDAGKKAAACGEGGCVEGECSGHGEGVSGGGGVAVAGASGSGAGPAPKETDAMEVDASNDTVDDDGDEEYETVTEVHPVTLETLQDTLTTHAQVLSAMSREVQDPSAHTLHTRAVAKLDAARALVGNVAAVRLLHADLLAAHADTVLQLEGRLDSALFDAAVAELDALLAESPRHVEALCDRGDVLSSHGEALRARAADPADADRVRALYAAAERSYAEGYAAESNNVALAAKLGDVNLLRVGLYAGPESEAARRTLAGNAEKYYRRAIALKVPEIGIVMWRLAKAVALGPEGAEGCQKVLRAWRRGRRRAGEMVDDDVPVDFPGEVRACPWFAEIVHGVDA
ncbi:hypothetical protein BDK51DRAFT_39881 [Blyttiomyces helicus]|uniref:Uncharacterized protein n=1 Tax=Blyttiomyces helicus TaxID=388810 RepID=A0A4P9W5P3_9FUNG|nr:hypothetical protein BDK51DRAFT_39881 [Blyttiomyces helicus]|eukprot:RKO86653.1 hypothetical protein BDK51DRAFT_39881 [Blyttiomyces helicus]